MKLSIVVPVLNSHEIVRRQLLHFRRIGVPDQVEIIYVDDGSSPEIEYPPFQLHRFRIVRTGDMREWTWALARNRGADEAAGEYLLMTDLDYIIPKDAIEDSLKFSGDYMGFRREFGILDAEGNPTQDMDELIRWGLDKSRIPSRGVRLPPHPNNFVIRRSLFFEMGKYREDRVGLPYPQGEDGLFKKQRCRFREEGRLTESEYRPLLYMFPNGQWCGDVDFNPMGMFHDLSRKTANNYWHTHPRKYAS